MTTSTKFKHREIDCVIIELPSMSPMVSIGPYHNGYVKVKGKPHYDKHIAKVNSEELTFSGTLKSYDGWFLGFDSVHFDDTQATQSFDAVKARTIKLCDELIKLKLAKKS